MRAPEILVWACERLLKRLGWLKVDDYDARHRVTPAKMKAALADRMQNVGIQQAQAPDPEAETAQINPGVVQVIASLREWKREQVHLHAESKSTPSVIEPHETGIGILQPVVDLVDDQSPVHFGFCTSTLVVEDDPHTYECEKEDDDKHGDTCSAFGGEVTWPRSEMAVSVS